MFLSSGDWKRVDDVVAELGQAGSIAELEASLIGLVIGLFPTDEHVDVFDIGSDRSLSLRLSGGAPISSNWMQAWRERYRFIIPPYISLDHVQEIVNWRRFGNDEYSSDFVLPQKITSSLFLHVPTVDSDQPDGTRALRFNSIVIHRGPGSGFSVRELNIAFALRRHLDNLYCLIRRLDGMCHEHYMVAELARSAARLSQREAEITGYLCQRLTAADIALRLHISVRTVETHVRGIYQKLDVDRRDTLVRKIAKMAIVDGVAIAGPVRLLHLGRDRGISVVHDEDRKLRP